MLRTIKEIIYHSIYEKKEFTKLIRINAPNYYGFSNLLDSFLELVENPENITVITVKHSSYKLSIKRGLHTLYLYDLLDFDDQDFYLNKPIGEGKIIILENIDTISENVVSHIEKAISPTSTMYLISDNFIPRRYVSEKDIANLNSNQYNVQKVISDKETMPLFVRQFLNGVRSSSRDMEDILDPEKLKRIDHREISTYHIGANLDLNSVIITPHISYVRNLNWMIREYLGFTLGEDPVAPRPGEWLVVDRAAECITGDGTERFILHTGYRFRAKTVGVHHDGLFYQVQFDYTKVDGTVVEVTTNVAKRYLEYMAQGDSDLPHAPMSYCIYYGYVVPGFYTVNNEFDDVTILYDKTLAPDKKDLYTCALSCRKNLTLLFNRGPKRMNLKR